MTREPDAVAEDLAPAEGFLAADANEGPSAVEVCFVALFCFLAATGSGGGDAIGGAGRAGADRSDGAAEPGWAPDEGRADSPDIF